MVCGKRLKTTHGPVGPVCLKKHSFIRKLIAINSLHEKDLFSESGNIQETDKQLTEKKVSS